MYLLHHELSLLVGPYIILQVIYVSSLTQTFISDVGPNRTPPLNPQGAAPVFHLELKYYAGDPKIPLNTPGYKNGNITAMYWQVKSGSVEKPGGGEKFGGHKMAYEFKYDKLDRLKSARFVHIYQEQGQEVYVNNDAYGVPSIGYDKIGNITALWRKGPLVR